MVRNIATYYMAEKHSQIIILFKDVNLKMNQYHFNILML